VAAASVTESAFGSTPDGTAVRLFTLTNSQGLVVQATSYGCIITSIKTPDRHGRFDDIVVGHDNLDGYLTKTRYFGAVVGRYGNRIAGGQITIDGKTYQLTLNNGPNHLHGGVKGFDKVVWDAKTRPDPRGVSVEFTHTSPAGHEGYPGKVDAAVVYTLTDTNELIVEYSGTTDAPTILNMTQHSYFNLSGDGAGDVMGHLLTLHASGYTPVDANQIPTGEIVPVDGTPFDFRRETVIGARIDGNDPQLTKSLGYDHNFVLARNGNGLAPAARLVDPKTGRTMDVSTTEPGVQFYSGNKLDGSMVGKGGHVYSARTGLCLETQHYPDSPNKPQFPSTIVRPGEKYRSSTVFTFGVVS
jgi:aldose 1-epimerase